MHPVDADRAFAGKDEVLESNLSFPVWQLHNSRHIAFLPLLLGFLCSVIIWIVMDDALKMSLLVDAFGAAGGAIFLRHQLRTRDTKLVYQTMQVVGPAIGGLESLVMLLQTPPPPDKMNTIWQVHQTIKLLCVSGLVGPVVLNFRSVPYLVANACAAVSFLHYNFAWACVMGWLYAHSVGVMVGYVLTWLRKDLYKKERELLAARKEQARLLEALRESNERREIEIRILSKKARMVTSVQPFQPALQNENCDKESQSNSIVSRSRSLKSHHTAKVNPEVELK